jgi:hypothetical protein
MRASATRRPKKAGQKEIEPEACCGFRLAEGFEEEWGARLACSRPVELPTLKRVLGEFLLLQHEAVCVPSRKHPSINSTNPFIHKVLRLNAPFQEPFPGPPPLAQNEVEIPQLSQERCGSLPPKRRDIPQGGKNEMSRKLVVTSGSPRVLRRSGEPGTLAQGQSSSPL